MNIADAYKFKGRYRISSARLKYYDYSGSGGYFITICTKNCKHYLGKIIDGKIELTNIGMRAGICWQEISKHYPFVKLDQYIVMPNHVHGIIFINKNNDVMAQNPAIRYDKKLDGMSGFNKFGPQSGNLGSIIRGFKIGVKKHATQNNLLFEWQSRFYDHIVRNEEELKRIRQYIIENPLKWELDKNNPENLYM